MSLRIAIDLDGTVADLSRALNDLAAATPWQQQQDGHDVKPADDAPAVGDGAPASDRPRVNGLRLSSHDLDRLWGHALAIPEFWTTLPEVERGVVRRVQHLADERGWEVLFTTTRPAAAGRTTQVQSQEWLVSHGFRYPSVFVVEGSRGRIAEALDLRAIIDDRPESCLEVAQESAATAILVWPYGRAHLGDDIEGQGVVVTACIGDAIDEAVRMDAPAGGVVRMLKRMLGRR